MKYLNCPNCDNVGWCISINPCAGDYELAQCEFCHVETNSIFNTIIRLEAENAKLKKDAAKIRVEAIKEAATMCCPVSGYVVRDEQARKELMEYAAFLEKTESE